MGQQPANTRNDALEFARRTRLNLEFIEGAAATGEDVHVVTQLAISLLGLVVIPKEKLLLNETKEMTIANMRADGWPEWTITEGETKTLWDIIRHLRNAVAHGRVTFTSDSRDIDEVTIEVEDKDPKIGKMWRARIDAWGLRGFCVHFLDFIEDTIG